MGLKKTTEEFLKDIKNKNQWDNNYDYSKVEYTGASKKVLIIDKRYNSEHLIQASEVLIGTKCTGSNLLNGYWNYDDSSNYVQRLENPPKSYKEWNEFANSKKRPHQIPFNPQRRYKDVWNERGGLGGFLGTDRISDNLKEYPPYGEVKKEVQKYNLKSKREYDELWDKGEFPNFPKTIHNTYKDEFVDYADFLDIKPIRSKRRKIGTYEEHQEFAELHNLKSKGDWWKYLGNNDVPLNINTNPQRYFKDIWKENGGWVGFCKTELEKNRYKGGFINYEECKKLINSEGIKTPEEYVEFYDKTYKEFAEKKERIPMSPSGGYKKDWISWRVFLGTVGDGKTTWLKRDVKYFIEQIRHELVNLDSIELITIINSNNLARKIKDLGFLEDLVSSKSNTVQRENVVSKIQKHISDLVGSSDEEEEEEELVENVFEEELKEGDDTFYDSIEEVEELKDFKPLEELKFYDNKLITSSLDDENIDFLLKNQLKKLWNSVLNNEISVDEILKEDGGKNFKLIKNKFINEYKEVLKITPPQDYVFKYPPNLMQKLVTYRMKQEKLYGNWSGTGAGKTLSSIFCGRYLNLKNTIIVCNNSTITGWVNSIHEYFDKSSVYTKTTLNNNDVKPNKYNIVHKYDINLEVDRFNYIVLNYETFQLEDGEFIVSELLKKNSIDYIILDEVQNVKQRSEKDESSRRNVINKLIIHSKNENPNLHLMVMSATPVINNLVEPKKLIELISGEVHEELEAKSSISNGIEMYKSLTRFGIRYKPKYGISVNENLIQVNGDDLIDELKKIPKGSPTGFEKVLINTKLESIKQYLKKGTLIYSHYVTDLVNVIGEFVGELGYTYGFYTGDDKEGLRRFKNKEIDILIGSAPIGTGVDGIQYVCNTLIPLILPWTSSEYEQLLGRVNRQGSNFENINVYIPQVVVSRGDKEWSWDKRRYNIIKFKSTLADLSVDGIIPKELSPPKSTLVKQAQKELEEWIDRISENDILTIDREEIKIPLNPKQIEYKKKELGDFSELNKKWSVSNSKTIKERLKKDKSEWNYYHTLYREKRKEWNEIPYVEISKKLKGREDWLIADLGCGENLLSKEINNKVLSFDYVGIDDSVNECDISNLPLKDNKVDVSVFSLSLMGSNYIDYLKEGYRILKPYGNMFIVEPKKKWENKSEKLVSELDSIGLKIVENYTSNRFLYLQLIKIK
ncbi:SNF2-related protein [Flavobacteriaceae bacterium]|nr:SNF2-related protein [Flavobacteriaceae bacterium]